MQDDPGEAAYAGRTRDMQNWIGGSDYSPRNACTSRRRRRVEGYLDDLVAFTNRDDLSAMVQAAIAHAQFESIHPFRDGNGRIGRALVNTVLRRRGVTTTVVVPLASALVARREAYFEVLTRYRDGDPEPIIAAFARASTLAAQESRVTAARMAEFPGGWRDAVGRVRSDSATARLLAVLPAMPVFSAVEVEQRWAARPVPCTAPSRCSSTRGTPAADRPQAQPGVGVWQPCSTSSMTSTSGLARRHATA